VVQAMNKIKMPLGGTYLLKSVSNCRIVRKCPCVKESKFVLFIGKRSSGIIYD